jgi:hypothetical protein
MLLCQVSREASDLFGNSNECISEVIHRRLPEGRYFDVFALRQLRIWGQNHHTVLDFPFVTHAKALSSRPGRLANQVSHAVEGQVAADASGRQHAS